MAYQTKTDKLYKKIDRLEGLIEDIQATILDDDSDTADSIRELISEYEGEEEW